MNVENVVPSSGQADIYGDIFNQSDTLPLKSDRTRLEVM